MTMTKRPPLLFSLPLLFWAWQSGHWLAGIATALWLEWTGLTRQRWSLSGQNINRIVDLTALGLIAVALYSYSKGPFADALFAILHWSPLLLLPLLSAQLLSERQGIEYRALFYSLRNSQHPKAAKQLDLVYTYVAACLMAAAQGATEPLAYFPVLALLLGWLLWWQRPKASHPALWVLLLILASGLGYAGQMGLHRLQAQLEEAAIQWLAEFFSGETNPFRARTALGDIGTLKLSDEILYRIETEAPLQSPLLLRTASYNRYVETTWFSREQAFKQIPSGNQANQWLLSEGPQPPQRNHSVRIDAYLTGSKGILPLPGGTWRIDQLAVAELALNPLGAAQVTDGPPLLRYQARFGEANNRDLPPLEIDLRVPRVELPALQQFARQLPLDKARPEQAMQRLHDHFQNQFGYTVELPGRKFGQTALGHFLLERRKGHCEYFATATVMLLRQAGIPARYAFGYSVQEQAGQPNRYLVRSSHAHAWTLVWHHGRWWDLDTTPAVWFNLEEDQRPLWQPLFDLFSEIYYQFRRYQSEPDSAANNPWLWGILALLFAILAYRLRLGKTFKRQQAPATADDNKAPPSPLSAIEQALTEAGYPRAPIETYGQWLQRLEKQPTLAERISQLGEILRLHYILRYRPGGLDPTQQQQMQQLVENWLKAQ